MRKFVMVLMLMLSLVFVGNTFAGECTPAAKQTMTTAFNVEMTCLYGQLEQMLRSDDYTKSSKRLIDGVYSKCTKEVNTLNRVALKCKSKSAVADAQANIKAALVRETTKARVGLMQ